MNRNDGKTLWSAFREITLIETPIGRVKMLYFSVIWLISFVRLFSGEYYVMHSRHILPSIGIHSGIFLAIAVVVRCLACNRPLFRENRRLEPVYWLYCIAMCLALALLTSPTWMGK